MGKKKGYNVAEMDSKQEDKKIEIKESFTVQDYDGTHSSILIFPITMVILVFELTI